MVLASSGWNSVNCCNFLEASVIKLDGLQFWGEFQALGEAVFSGLQDLVAKVIIEASEQQLMLKELCHVIYPFDLGLVGNGTGESYGGHGVGLVVCEALVGCLHPDMVVFKCFARLLDQVSKVGTNFMCPVLWLVRLEELPLTDVPVLLVVVVIFQGLPPDNGLVPEDNVELSNFTVVGPGGDIGRSFDPLKEMKGSDQVFLLFP
jgi:hypothetical protein